ncbi:MAG: hypothetical protein ABJD13_16705 [Paracoccaceae bacterium]
MIYGWAPIREHLGRFSMRDPKVRSNLIPLLSHLDLRFDPSTKNAEQEKLFGVSF